MQIRERQMLEADIPIFRREIRNMYLQFDKRLGLHGADVPIKFTFEESVLGSYTPKSEGVSEHFTFSLHFIGWCNKNPIHRMDRIDLFAHEYAHYMQYHYDIPKEHLWKPGKHGSAWMYCCSLVGAAPTEFYKFGEGLLKHDYEKALYNPMADPNYVLKDRRRILKKQEDEKNSRIRFKIGEEIHHPKFGMGVIEDFEPVDGSVRVKIRFGDILRTIDQKWLLQSQFRKH